MSSDKMIETFGVIFEYGLRFGTFTAREISDEVASRHPGGERNNTYHGYVTKYAKDYGLIKRVGRRGRAILWKLNLYPSPTPRSSDVLRMHEILFHKRALKKLLTL